MLRLDTMILNLRNSNTGRSNGWWSRQEQTGRNALEVHGFELLV